MKSELDNGKICETLRYLDTHKMSVELLRDLHHNRERTETYTRALNYRTGGYSSYNEKNLAYHRRLLFVAAEHQRKGCSFDELVAQALIKFPKEEA